MNRRDAEAQRINDITQKIIGACIEIHRQLGPGLLESAYEECLCYDLSMLRLGFERQKELPVAYKTVRLACGYKIDIVVERLVVVELKAVEKLLPLHEAQSLTYLKLSGLSLGLLINFNVPILRQGIKRIANNFADSSAPQRLCGLQDFSP